MQLTIQAPSILVCTKPVDFRKSINGLLDIALSDLNVDVRSHIFIFYNRDRDKIKILAWHKNGFVLLLKRLEEGKFFNALDDAAARTMTRMLAAFTAVAIGAVSQLVHQREVSADRHSEYFAVLR